MINVIVSHVHLFFSCYNFCEPIEYLKYITAAIKNELSSRRDVEKAYAMLVDSDTMWSVSDINSIWHKYECALDRSYR